MADEAVPQLLDLRICSVCNFSNNDVPVAPCSMCCSKHRQVLALNICAEHSERFRITITTVALDVAPVLRESFAQLMANYTAV